MVYATKEQIVAAKHFAAERFIRSTHPVLCISGRRDFQGVNQFRSDDAYGRLCTRTGALWTPQGYKLDGTDDYIQADDRGFPIGATSRTVEVWVKRASSANFTLNEHIFKYGTSVLYQDFGLYGVVSTTDIQFRGNSYDFDTGINLDDTNWHHIALTFDGTNLRAYKDSLLISTTDRSLLDTVLSANQMVIGASKVANQYWNGFIGEVLVYNRVLSLPGRRNNYAITRWLYR